MASENGKVVETKCEAVFVNTGFVPVNLFSLQLANKFVHQFNCQGACGVVCTWVCVCKI